MNRILFVGFGQESNTFCPFSGGTDAFKARSLSDPHFEPLLKTAAALDVEIVSPGFFWATPGGLVPQDLFDGTSTFIIDECRKIVSTGDVQGILLALHGSIQVSRIGHGESEFIKRLQAAVGSDKLIAASLDLHGNINPELIEMIDIPCAYRTAPHRDGIDTMSRALKALCICISEKIKPVRAFAQIPVLLPGEKAMTAQTPAKELYARLSILDAHAEILSASILVGFAWADVENAGASIIVVGRSNTELIIAECEKLALAYWKVKDQFGFNGEVASIEEALIACERSDNTIFLSDSGDNVTAGAPGDNALLLKHVLAAKIGKVLIAGICDAPAVQLCKKVGIGNVIETTVGGTLLPGQSVQIDVNGIVSYIDNHESPTLAIIKAGEVEIVVTTARVPFISPKQMIQIGINPLEKDVVVVKLGYLYPELEDISPRTIMVLTPGPSGQLVETFNYKNIRRPMYPLDPEWNWTPQALVYK